ncbi:MAG TPA: tetratricopeptide repeat protein [bacterium]|nr:tetratricopeptide repeat protein [bacterium]
MARIDDYAPDLWQIPAGEKGDTHTPPPPTEEQESSEEVVPLAHPKIQEALKEIEECFLAPGGSLSLFCGKFQDQETVYLHEDLAQWEAENPYDTSKQLELGYHYLYVMQDYPKAVLAYHSALKVFDLDPEIHENLGKAYFGMGEYGKSKDVYEAALELDPRNAEIRALHAEASQKYLEALKDGDADEVANVRAGIDADRAMLRAVETEKRIEEEQRKAAMLIDLGKTDQAKAVLKGIKDDLIASLSEAEGEALKDSPRYEILRVRSRLLRAEIAGREGDAAKAVDIQRKTLPALDRLLNDDPSNQEASRLRAGVVQTLSSAFDLFEAEGNRANAEEDLVREMYCLNERLKIAEALSWTDEAADLSGQIDAKSGDAVLEKMTRDAEDLAAKGFIPAEQMQILVGQDYADLPLEEKMAALQELHRVGLIGQNKAALEKETDPTKKLFFGYKIDLLEGRLVEGELKVRDFKDQVGEKFEADPKLFENDPELEVAYEEARQALRGLTLQHIEELKAQTEAIGEQRHKHLFGYLDYFSPKDHIDFLRVLGTYVRAGRADTLEEAVAAMEADYPKRFCKFWERTAVGKGEHAAFRMPETTEEEREKAQEARSQLLTALYQKSEDASLFDPKGYPDLFFAKIDGGTLEIARSYNTELDTKPLRVVVGREGGFLQFPGAFGGQVYFFPPSDREKVVLVERNELVAVNLNEGDYFHDPENASQHKWDYASIFPIRNQFVTIPNFMGTGIDHKKKWLGRLEKAIPHLHRLQDGYKDPLLTSLFHRYTREGLEKEATPEGRRAAMLSYARRLSEKDGSFPMAEASLKEVMREEYTAALDAVEADGGVAEAVKEVEEDRDDIEERVREQFQAQIKHFDAIAKLRRSDEEDKALKQFRENYPDGVVPEEVIQQTIRSAMEQEIRAKLDLKAYAVLDRWADEGKITDPLSLEAWNELESQKDPTGEVFRISREGWADACNFIETEAVMFAITAPLTMGVGSLVRGGLGGLSLVRGLVAQGGWRALAVRGGIFLAGAAAEGMTMTGLGGAFGSEFAAEGVGFNIVMSCLFHAGGKGWGKIASKLGIDDEAIRLAAAAGESTAGKRLGNIAGALGTQTKLGVGWTYLHEVLSDSEDPRNFWERLGQEGFRMGWGHVGNMAINVAFDYAPMRYEMLASGRQKVAKEAFKTLYSLHLSDLDAHGVFGEEAAGIARQRAAREASAYAAGLNAGADTGKPVLVFDQDAAIAEMEAEKARHAEPAPETVPSAHEELGIADTVPVPLLDPDDTHRVRDKTVNPGGLAGPEVPPVLSEMYGKIHELKQFTARHRGEPLVDHIAGRVALCEAALLELHRNVDLYRPDALTDVNVQAELLAVGEMLNRGLNEMAEVRRVLPLAEGNDKTLPSPQPRGADSGNTLPLSDGADPQSLGLDAWRQLEATTPSEPSEAMTQEKFHQEVIDSWTRRDARRASARNARRASGNTGVTRVEPGNSSEAAAAPNAAPLSPAEAVAFGYPQAWEGADYWSGIRGNFPILLRATGKILKMTMQGTLPPASGAFAELAETAAAKTENTEIKKRAGLMVRALERVYDYYPAGDPQKAFIEGEVAALTRDMTADSSEAALPIYWSRLSDVFAHLMIEHAGRSEGTPRNPVLDFQLQVASEYAIVPGAEAPQTSYRTQRF